MISCRASSYAFLSKVNASRRAKEGRYIPVQGRHRVVRSRYSANPTAFPHKTYLFLIKHGAGCVRQTIQSPTPPQAISSSSYYNGTCAHPGQRAWYQNIAAETSRALSATLAPQAQAQLRKCTEKSHSQRVASAKVAHASSKCFSRSTKYHAYERLG